MPRRERWDGTSAVAVQGGSHPRAGVTAPKPVAASWASNSFSLSSEWRLIVLFLRGNKAFQKYICKSYMVMETTQVSQRERVCQALLLSVTCVLLNSTLKISLNSALPNAFMLLVFLLLIPFLKDWIKTYLSPFKVPISVKQKNQKEEYKVSRERD